VSLEAKASTSGFDTHLGARLSRPRNEAPASLRTWEGTSGSQAGVSGGRSRTTPLARESRASTEVRAVEPSPRDSAASLPNKTRRNDPKCS